MADYAIGDIQGCYDPLMRLLEHIQFDDQADRLWFVGDLVNRGPQSLDVLRFIKQLPLTPRITLGNHDLHLLSRLFSEATWTNEDDTLHDIEQAPDAHELGHWLRKQHILYYDKDLNVVMSHAGIVPVWTLMQAQRFAKELEDMLWSDDYHHFLTHMYGNEPDMWSNELVGVERLRYICNSYTRMRFCKPSGRMAFNYKGTIAKAPADLCPWFQTPGRIPIEADIVFGHWAALGGIAIDAKIHAIDTGCLWGGELTALRLQDKMRYSVPGMVSKA